jgi:photosystem II stability/assembly factor-like uncharacterized protein
MKKIVAIFLALAIPQTAFAAGESIGSLSHIHNVEVYQKKILLGTHAGLYSGHPGPGSKLPQPVGLLLSVDAGQSWRQVALQGKVDFHQLETLGAQLYGADSQSGDLMYSSDFGKKWGTVGKNTFSDIAISPSKKRSALAIQDGKLVQTQDNFNTVNEVKVSQKFSQIEWNQKQLIASTGANLYESVNQGKSWKRIYGFNAPIGVLAHSPELLVAVVGDQIWKSSDNGRTFALVR